MRVKILNLDDCQTNKEVSQAIKDHVKSHDLEEITTYLSKDFYNQEKTIKRLYACLATGKNLILYGPGGFGKSEIIKAFFKLLNIPVYYKIGHEGMTEEDLLGVPNMDKLLKESKYEIAFENSVFKNKGVLILEEFLDARSSVAIALKDIITERGFRDGDDKKESLISNIIIAGNKNPDELSVDNTTAAFYEERFPIRQKVIWPAFKESNYLNFYEIYYKDRYKEEFKLFSLLAKLIVSTNASDKKKFISPRIAKEIADIVLELGLEFIDVIDQLDLTDYKQFLKDMEKQDKTNSDTSFLLQMEEIIKSISEEIYETDEVEKYKAPLRAINDKLHSRSLDDQHIRKLLELSGKVKILEEYIDTELSKNNDVLNDVQNTLNRI